MPRRLLAALLVEPGKTRGVDVLAEALWGRRPPQERAKALQLYVSRLRKALAEGVQIRTDSSGYALELDKDVLDAARFERLLNEARAASDEGNASLAASLLDGALSLWRGQAFGEFAYEEFARAEAERLQELRLVALEERSEAQLRLGRHQVVVGELRESAVAHPLRERMQAQLMLALYRCGRQTEALDVYASLRKRLRDELGLEPGEEMRELQRRILQHDPTLARAAASADHMLPLPAPPNRLLGRERELAKLRRLLVDERVRLLVLTGAGGSGKTRLALEAARATADAFGDGVCWVELAPLRDPKLVVGAIARALALETVPGEEPLETVAAALRPRELLLVLDNAEHLLAATPLFPHLLAQAPRVSLLVTSRTVLHLSGEHVYPVAPLDEPAAVALFGERAREADARFQATGQDERSIQQICRRLDGLPLALELAAGRTRTLTPAELLDRLEPRLPLLTGGPRDLPARQQTLRATLEWSYDLLADDERRDLRRLAIFAGGCTLEAAEAVCETAPERLAALVEHNLLQHHTTPIGSRYTMLETIREYAIEHVEQTNEAETLRRRHAQWYCELTERLLGLPGQWSLGSDIDERVARMQEEDDNVRSALAWAWSSGQDELALRLGAACCRFWIWGGGARSNDARAWLEAAEAHIAVASPPTQLQALKAAGLIAFHVLADSMRADRHWTRALAVAEEREDADETAWIESMRAGVVWERGDLEQALALRERQLAHARASGNRVGEAQLLHFLGEVLRDLGRFDEAERTLRAADALARELNYRSSFVAANTHSLGDLALDRGDVDAAFGLYRESLDAAQALQAQETAAICLAGIASVLAERKSDDEAATVWGAVCAAEETLGFRMLGAERRRYESRLARLEHTPAWTCGRGLSLEEAATAIPKS